MNSRPVWSTLELQDSQDYRVIPCLETKTKKEKKEGRREREREGQKESRKKQEKKDKRKAKKKRH